MEVIRELYHLTYTGKLISSDDRIGFNRKAGRMYTSSAYKKAKEELALNWLSQAHPEQPLGYGVGVDMIIWVQDHEPDIDAYLKVILDSGNGILWADDKNIINLRVNKSKKLKGFDLPDLEMDVIL